MYQRQSEISRRDDGPPSDGIPSDDRASTLAHACINIRIRCPYTIEMVISMHQVQVCSLLINGKATTMRDCRLPSRLRLLAVLPGPFYNPLEILPLLLTQLILFGIALSSMKFALIDKGFRLGRREKGMIRPGPPATKSAPQPRCGPYYLEFQ